MKRSALSTRYARALWGFAGEADKVQTIVNDLLAFGAALDACPDLRELFQNPSFRKERARVTQIVGETLTFSPLGMRCLLFLVEKGRIGLLSDIASSLTALIEAHSGRVRVRVTTAVPLPEDRFQHLRAALERLVEKTVILDREVDPDILGGVVAHIGTTVYDASLKGYLAQFRSRQISPA